MERPIGITCILNSRLFQFNFVHQIYLTLSNPYVYQTGPSPLFFRCGLEQGTLSHSSWQGIKPHSFWQGVCHAISKKSPQILYRNGTLKYVLLVTFSELKFAHTYAIKEILLVVALKIYSSWMEIQSPTASWIMQS